MRVTQHDMEAGHRRIVEGASRLLRERGLRDTSVADAMQAAGMTHGGFYRHFENKDQLVAEALQQAFDEFVEPLVQRPQVEPPAQVAAEYRALYLSAQHLEHPDHGCPMPALGSEVARAGEAVKSAFSAGVQRLADALCQTIEGGSAEERRAVALRELALLAGALLIARASDAPTARAVLEACRDRPG